MQNYEKYKNILLNTNLVSTDTEAEKFVEVLYQLAFTVVTQFCSNSEREN